MKKHKIIHELEPGILYYMKVTTYNIHKYQNSDLRLKNKIPKMQDGQANRSTYLWFFKHRDYIYSPQNKIGTSNRNRDDFLAKALDAFDLEPLEISFDGVDMIDLSTYRRSSIVKKIKRRSIS